MSCAMRARADVEAWLAAYERAWRTAGTGSLGDLFTSDATYQMSPYEAPLAGLDAIAKMWTAMSRSRACGSATSAPRRASIEICG